MLWYIIEGACTALLHMLKYVPGAQGVDEAVNIRPRYLTFVLDQAVLRRGQCAMRQWEMTFFLWYMSLIGL